MARFAELVSAVVKSDWKSGGSAKSARSGRQIPRRPTQQRCGSGWFPASRLCIVLSFVFAFACGHKQRLYVENAGHMGRVTVDGGMSSTGSCDGRKRLLLELRATCQTRGGFVVRIPGLPDSRIEEDLPKDEGRQMHTEKPVPFPRTVSVVEMTIFGICSGSGEDLIGAHSCQLDVSGGCR